MALLKQIFLIFFLVLALFSFDEGSCAKAINLYNSASISAIKDSNILTTRRKNNVALLSLASTKCSFSVSKMQNFTFGTSGNPSCLYKTVVYQFKHLNNKIFANYFSSANYLLAHVLFPNAP